MANKNFRVRHGLDIGDSVSVTDAGTATGITTLASVSNGNITLAPNGTGDVLLTADTVQVGDANATATITTNGTGDLVLNTNSGTNAGSVTLANGTNGNITLAPNGTGDLVLTFNNGGNLINSRNYVLGAIRNATTEAAGNIWSLNQSAGTQPFRGLTVDNSADTAILPGFVGRSYSNTAGFRSRLIFERARGTAASPSRVLSGDFLGEVDATGYSSTGWVNDTLTAVPGFFGFTAVEDWTSNTNLGTGFGLSLAPSATTIATGANLVACLTVSPQTFASRSDSFTWANGKTGTTQTMALDVSGNLTVTGDLRVNGNDIRSSDNTSQITTSAAGTTLALKGDTITLEAAGGTDFVVIDANTAKFNVPVTTELTTTTISEGTTYTPAATVDNNISVQIDTLAGGTTVIDLASLTGNSRGASYNILVFNNTASGTAIQVKNTRINTNNLMTHTITTGSPRIIINAYVVGDYATATHLVVA